MNALFDFKKISESINNIIMSKTEGMTAEAIEGIYGYNLLQINQLLTAIKEQGSTEKREILLVSYLKNLENIIVENPNHNLFRVASEPVQNKRMRTFKE